MTKSEEVNLVLLGNTGSGKSYISRALGCDFVSTRSADGHGVTRYIQTAAVELNGVKYTVIDTPGLVENDKSKMQENADEIVKALKTGGKFKILVVVRDESGRDDTRVSYFAKKIHDAVPENVKLALVMNKVAVCDIDRVNEEAMAKTCQRYNEYGNIFDPSYVMKIKEANLPPGNDDYTSQNAKDSFRLIKLDLIELLEKMDPVDINPTAVKSITANEKDYSVWEDIVKWAKTAGKAFLKAALDLFTPGTYGRVTEEIEKERRKLDQQ
ncbi:hypothetical protein EC973_001874 [Apophysomyces ossiformis]|uniref:G domain-containing protein n=1 Tax=Apophysomyces ossiformis TaxID=679940 RepID=A0A8H7EMV8_9FUNG|nr:hypothetical protein EC973_001874 [Apophysomyces ossiformis]